VKVNAINEAKEKAEYLSSSINQTIGKAIFIQELDNQYISNALSGRVSGVNVIAYGISKNSNESSMPDIEFEKINIQYSILVRFELK
ncbi:MAG TPA: SIMPL domain-containing protein, partial [Bacteroidia bacterium]